jgi:hypothetical protein
MHMSSFRPWYLSALMLVAFGAVRTAPAELLTYKYVGIITDVFQNENNVIPDLAAGDSFTGYATFESAGWNHTAGTVFASLNGIDLLFTGQYIYGNASLEPSGKYQIRIAGDTGGAIGGSTFSAGNFGPELIDTDGSAGYSELFPASFKLDEFEVNEFLISGSLIDSGNRVSAGGQLSQFFAVPESSTFVLAALGALTVGSFRRKTA